jgi:hypothetical protein
MSNVEWLRATVSPIPKPRKEQRPPASLSSQENSTSKEAVDISWGSEFTELKEYPIIFLQDQARQVLVVIVQNQSDN